MYTYDAVKVHQVTSTFIGTSYGYDAAGNMTSRTIGGTSYTLVYDQENRLYTVSGGATATFLYDGDAKRVKGTVGTTTTYYVGDYYERDAGGMVKQYYSIGGVRVAMKENTILRYLLSDHLGSTALNVSQALVKDSEVRYYAFGSDRFTSGTMPTTYRYTGQRAEQGIGLYYYNARWYDAVLGRFAQADTIVPQPGNPQSLNRYSYVLNNPLRFLDPTGLFTEDQLREWGITDERIKWWQEHDPSWWAILAAADFGDVVQALWQATANFTKQVVGAFTWTMSGGKAKIGLTSSRFGTQSLEDFRVHTLDQKLFRQGASGKYEHVPTATAFWSQKPSPTIRPLAWGAHFDWDDVDKLDVALDLFGIATLGAANFANLALDAPKAAEALRNANKAGTGVAVAKHGKEGDLVAVLLDWGGSLPGPVGVFFNFYSLYQDVRAGVHPGAW
jgi:RHS repeat-associated protein